MPKTEKLFVYGIFLDKKNREWYGMSNPVYDTVINYVTIGDIIVHAEEKIGYGYALTGLLVDMDVSGWERLDRLESGYDRIKIVTTSGEEARIRT